MTILVTRPSPAGEQLVTRLRKRGYSAYHSPLIEFSPGDELAQLPARLAALRPGDLIFALSQHAIDYADPLLARTGAGWPQTPAYYAIGRATALALHKVSARHVAYPEGRETSETLLQLPELQHINGKQALLLRGNGGRELLGAILAERGAQVSYCECYRRSPVYYDGLEQSRHWQQAGIDRLVITSGEMLQQIYTLVPDYYRASWLLGCQLIVVSERLAAQARQLGWHNIRVADNADNDALMRALQ
ncbi:MULTISPECIES: uroporphyrinogen-III synthase [unclassified Brenneria]|uniref:uroporphyrinogen-III synthase n=1 Tax=unclassified Brenneria TaxID=2634434 RepID=UPI0015558FC9|nr:MULTISPECIES: uroporphyrinogen-III synthase [unclassified Brenneria]MBJ7223063.1 uroporphyrinogen-III synthase [Brenneria sp. L3-3C-1]MEE3644302.1 uroporphyrinogen-III synthase [Brenneria sp. L3_3C_1]MEE3652527.1 uroporphyrinogen-III synthase [Brenneria sp. HEZEL_4_2_4]NPD02483.1 uroporphyrinogen-III synthase [Brenneria sp. hezel4-2-4]